MRSLIVNADDFGLTKSTSEGIVKAYKDGIVSCISFFPAGEAFSHSLGMVEAMGLKEAGAHLSLTGGMPVTEPSKIPTLVARDKKFHKNRNIFFLKFFDRYIAQCFDIGALHHVKLYTIQTFLGFPIVNFAGRSAICFTLISKIILPELAIRPFNKTLFIRHNAFLSSLLSQLPRS